MIRRNASARTGIPGTLRSRRRTIRSTDPSWPSDAPDVRAILRAKCRTATRGLRLPVAIGWDDLPGDRVGRRPRTGRGPPGSAPGPSLIGKATRMRVASLPRVLVGIGGLLTLRRVPRGRRGARRGPQGLHRRDGAGLEGARRGGLRQRQLRPRDLDLEGRGGALHRAAGRRDPLREAVHQLRARGPVAAPQARRQLGHLRLGAARRR